MAAVVIATIELGAPRVGLWCESCALPSLVECDTYLLTESGVSRGVFGTIRVCAECGPVKP